MSAGTSGCGCCSGVTQRTPLEVDNRPGLSAIAYRVGVHSEFLASMLAELTDADRPRLAALGTRDRDDFSIALLDAWAVAADVLAFYNERLAQESYLRTARERISLQELGRLIGYRLRPGVAAETYVAFALEPPPEVPAAASKDPGSTPPVTPTVVTLEPALRVQSIPGPGEQPQTFETVEEVEARPEWNAMPASQTVSFIPVFGDTHAYLEGAGPNLKPGDALLLAGELTDVLPDHWDLRVLSDRRAGRAERPHARHVGRAARLGDVGRDAGVPAAAVRPAQAARRLRSQRARSRARSPAKPGDGDWSFTLSPKGANYVDVEGSHPDVIVGSWVVLARPTYRELWRVKSVTELSRAQYAVSGKVTRLELEGGENYDVFDDQVRETKVFAVQETLALAEAPDVTDVAGGSLDVEVDVSEMREGRTLLVRGKTTGGEEHAEAVVVASALSTGGRWRLTLAADLAETYERESVIVHGNVALATHGETVQQLLGSGRASAPFQRFTLAHEPLTYRQSSVDPSGVDSELEVRVNDVRWDEVPTLYGAASRDRAYALRTDEQGKAYVQFGDGEHGARLPSGSNNVRAKYRKGIGAAGNVKPGALAQLLDRPLGVKGVSNPSAASGGVDPESEDSARASIPLGVRTLGRAVSLLDYEDFARAFSGVAKAHARGASAARRPDRRRQRRVRGRRPAGRSRRGASDATATRG